MNVLTEQPVLIDRPGPALLVTFNRPDRLNAWTDALEDSCFDAPEAADADPAIVVTGAGRGFCAGADMDDLASASEASDAEIDRSRPRHLPLTIRKPIVAAVTGCPPGRWRRSRISCRSMPSAASKNWSVMPTSSCVRRSAAPVLLRVWLVSLSGVCLFLYRYPIRRSDGVRTQSESC